MNPRDFCKKREYTTVIGTTYSFDPLFFERIILPDLKFGNSGEVLIIGDGDQLIQSFKELQRVTKKNSFVVLDAYSNEQEREELMSWNLTAKTIKHVNEWKIFFKEIGFTGDYYWFKPL